MLKAYKSSPECISTAFVTERSQKKKNMGINEIN